MAENKYANWLAMSIRLKSLKELEMKTRKQLCAEIFEGQVGALKKKFEEDGYKIVAENTVGYKLDEVNLKAMWEELTEAETQVIDWKPALKLGDYKKLPANVLLHECITVKPSTPTLKVTEIKE